MDYLSLKAAVAETRKRYTGLKVRDARQISTLEIMLQFHREKVLILSINPSRPGLFIVDTIEALPGLRTPFSDLLEARIKGTRMKSLGLPEPGERVVFLEFEAGWPAKSGNPHRIILEVMGRHSNLAVLQDETILQPLKIVPGRKSRLRPVLPGERWRPPPPRTGIAIEEITPEDLPVPSAASAAEELVQTVRGLSPYAARQAVVMTAGGDRQRLFGIFTTMVLSADGEGGFLHRAGNSSYLAPFEPVIAAHGESCEKFSPFSAASAIWRCEGRYPQTPEEIEKKQLANTLRKRESELRQALRILDREAERCRAHHKIRVMAETLLIHAAELLQGQETVVLPDPYEPDKNLTIPLDPSMSAIENADLMFAEAHRLRRGVGETSARRKIIEEELSTVGRSIEALLERGDPASARALLGRETGQRPGQSPGKYRSYKGPGKRFTAGEFTILVGRSALDNERVTFSAAGPHDLWLHARDYPGSHVVILTGKRKVPDNVLYRAAELAADASGARDEDAPEIMVTQRKWVKKPKGSKPGKVIVERHKTIRPRRR